jgi:hypothetical protein
VFPLVVVRPVRARRSPRGAYAGSRAAAAIGAAREVASPRQACTAPAARRRAWPRARRARAGHGASEEYVADDPIREAMQAAANAVASNDTRDFTLMQGRGCERIGTPPGMFIPGAFAPVD